MLFLTQIESYQTALLDFIAAQRASRKIETAAKQAQARVAVSRKSLASLGNPATVLDDLPEAEVTAKTNADGKCMITLPPAGKWVLVARAQRSVTNDDEEIYGWLVQIPQNVTRLMLSNDNVLNPFEDPLARLK